MASKPQVDFTVYLINNDKPKLFVIDNKPMDPVSNVSMIMASKIQASQQQSNSKVSNDKPTQRPGTGMYLIEPLKLIAGHSKDVFYVSKAQTKYQVVRLMRNHK